MQKKQYQRALSLIEEESTRNLYNVNVLQAMRSLNFNWDEIDEKIIYNCWRKTGIINSNATTNIHEEEEEIGIVTYEEEDDCVGSIRESELVQIGLGQ